MQNVCSDACAATSTSTTNFMKKMNRLDFLNKEFTIDWVKLAALFIFFPIVLSAYVLNCIWKRMR